MTNEYEWIGNYDRPGRESTGCDVAFALVALVAALAFMVL